MANTVEELMPAAGSFSRFVDLKKIFLFFSPTLWSVGMAVVRAHRHAATFITFPGTVMANSCFYFVTLSALFFKLNFITSRYPLTLHFVGSRCPFLFVSTLFSSLKSDASKRKKKKLPTSFFFSIHFLFNRRLRFL